MNKLIPALIIVGIIILGFILKLIELNKIIRRLDFTSSYHKKFIAFMDEIMLYSRFDQQLYYELTLEVNAMQYELGTDGIIAYMKDNLKGICARDYQLLVNFLPELRYILNCKRNSILMDRYNQSASNCDDMFIRHLGTLTEAEKSIRKNLFNPFSCFSNGVRFIISIPILLLRWFGFISDETAQKASRSWFLKLVNIVCTLVGFIGGLMSIIMGWDEFWQMICNIL